MTDCEYRGHTYATSELAAEARQRDEEQRQEVATLRARRAAEHEEALRQSFLATPGATPEQWEAEKAEILKKDREARALGREDRARSAQAALYRTF